MNNKQMLAKLVKAEQLLKRTKDGYPGPGKGTYWKPALALIHELERDLRPRPVPQMVFPIAGPDSHVFVGGLHRTAGLKDAHGVESYWALDFICKAGLGIVAPEAGTITRFSGNDPSDDSADARGVYGWSTYLRTAAGYEYFITHQGRRYPTLRPGMRVAAGDLLGYVGDQRYRPDHAHVGVHSPKGEADAKKHITLVSKAPKAS